jgi:N-acetylneuraminic acid mutarotase
MIKILFLSLCFLSFTVFGQTWQQLEDFPGTARDDGSCFVIDSFVYTGLGRDSGFSCMRDFYKYNAVTMTWSDCADLPLGEERQYAVGVSKNGLGYVFGGAKCDGSFSNDLWEYNPLSNSWSVLAPLPADGRGGSAHFVLGDTLFIVGGKNQQGTLSEVWAYDINNNQWTQKTALPGNGIWRGTSFEYNDLGFVGLGRNNLNNQTALNTGFYQFNSTTQQWISLPNPGLSPRCYIGTARTNNLVSFFGGLDASNVVLNDFHVLDVNSWLLSASMSFVATPRKGIMSFAFGSDFYFTTGISNTERFKETWRISNVLNVPTQTLSLNAYPNPCAEILTLNTNQGDIITIIDLSGRIVYSSQAENLQTNIDATVLFNGTYILKIEDRHQSIQIQH